MRGIEHIPWLYDALSALGDALGLRRWRRWVADVAAGPTLEVGCGTGRNLPLYPSTARVVGLDPDLGLLRRARARAAAVDLVCGRAETLPFPDAIFDTVVSSLAFCSVEDPVEALHEIRRVLRPDGRLRMLEHVRSRGRLRARYQDWVQPLWTRVTGGCRPNRDTEATVAESGFTIEEAGRRAKGDLRRFVARPIVSEGAASASDHE